MSVLEYYIKFLELLKFVEDIVHSERVRASLVFEGLNINLKKGILHCAKFRDCYNKALEFERLCDNEIATTKWKVVSYNNVGNKKAKPWVRKQVH